MNSLDIIITIAALVVAGRGAATGFFRQAGSLGGLVLGLMLGALLAPTVGQAFESRLNRPAASLLAFIAITIMASSMGEAVGHGLSGLAERFRLGSVNRVLGLVFGAVVVLGSAWFLSAVFVRSAGPALATEIQGSRILQTLDRSLPPAPDVLTRLERALGVTGFPRVFTGLEPAPAPPVTGPNAAAINAAITAGRNATVKIESVGCGGVASGSGFVAGAGLVATNAHVVAGVSSPTVIDAAGRHRAQVVVFNPDLDFAVLRTTGLASAPLELSSDVHPRGSVGAALGYPGGGPFAASPAAILSRQTAMGRNIYDAGIIRRDIYELQALVQPGNSGGPVVAPDGQVIGVVFARSTANESVGYALTSRAVLPDLRRAATARSASAGACMAH